MKNLYVVTHTQSRHHVEGRVGGWYDSELTGLGLEQAALVGERLRQLLPGDEPVEMYSSDLRRAKQTAAAIASRLRAPMQTTPDLREISYGEAGGRPQEWLDERFVHPPKHGNRLDHDFGVRGAETRRAFAGRIYRAVDDIVGRPCARQIIVTHGFALTFVVAAWIKLPLEAAGHIAIHATSGGITHLREDDLFHNRGIVTLNDTSHLNGTAPSRAM